MPTYTGGCACGVRFSGGRTSHCGACHETFSSVSGFDRHRRGGDGCRPPGEVGLVVDGRGWWRQPGGYYGVEHDEAAQPEPDGLEVS